MSLYPNKYLMLQRKSLNIIYGILDLLIPLCLVFEKVSTEAQQKICEAMLQCGEDWSNRGIKPFECAVCGKRFTTLNHLVRHRRIQTSISVLRTD